ncbi:MAG: shikimate dehydrogenase [Clostridia bacterium]|nr:shikimate dehydrogenase [Clostridia bacterium]
MKYGLIGEKLPHSYSKEIHEKLGRYEYELHPLERNELDGFMKAADFTAINVTIPYKTAVIPYLHGISERAKAIGAVNTVINKNGALYGDNTDHAGLTALICRSGFDMRGKSVLILGSGGTSKTSVAVCRDLCADKITVASRSGAEGTVTYGEAKALKPDFIINTTPCGMYPNEGVSAVDIKDFDGLSGVIDVIYNPLCTKLTLDCKKRGIPAVSGLYMLVYQATEAASLFLSERVAPDETERIYKEILNEKENVVLIGMPASGKSTIGKMIAKKMKKSFVDTDKELEKEIGDIAGFINTHGEAAFREAETKIIKEIAKKTRGAVISTGGGAVLRIENTDALSSNGVICFIDRDISKITPDRSRPLTQNRELLQKRYNERIGIYRAAADITVKNDSDFFANAAEALYTELMK